MEVLSVDHWQVSWRMDVSGNKEFCYHRQLIEIAYFFGSQKVSFKTAFFQSPD